MLFAVALIGVTGLLFFGNGIYLKAKALLAQHLIAWAWSNPEVKPWPWADTRPVARLLVPRLDIDLHVLEGDNLRTLAFGPGHRSSTPLPGEPGNSLIGGHRDTHFKFLRDLTPGDVLLVENTKGLTLRFIVENGFIADKNDPRPLAPSDDPMLTLVTCYPFDVLTPGGPLRYIVTAVPDARDRVTGASYDKKLGPNLRLPRGTMVIPLSVTDQRLLSASRS